MATTNRSVDRARSLDALANVCQARGVILVRTAILAFLLASLAGCSAYHHRYATPNVIKDDYEIQIVQADDFGSLWSTPDAQSILDHVTDVTNQTNTFVVVFIHGWHHNAAAKDSNLVDFSTTIQDLAVRLDDEHYRAARKALTGEPGFKLVGIYVGWRGRSLPGVLDYLTMWWRKAAAERVGDGDVSEFIERLQRIYLRANSVRHRGTKEGTRPMMGLVTIGHSFGGQVLMKTVVHGLESDLAQRAPRLADTTDAVPDSTDPVAERVAIDSYGDANILLNPALEAYQFVRIHNLYRQLKYPPCQMPQLIVFSADNDRPRKAFFPIARGLTRAFRPAFRGGQGPLYGTALGVLENQQTHDLNRLTPPNAKPDALSVDDYSSSDGPDKIRLWDFTSNTVFQGVELNPLAPEQRKRFENAPILVAATHEKLIDGHNGIFNSPFREFLTSYIAFLEGKRFLWRQKWRAEGIDRPTSGCQ